MPAAPCFYSPIDIRLIVNPFDRLRFAKRRGRRALRRAGLIHFERSVQAAGRGTLLRELRWKNSAWLATAETIAGWKGFEIRNAGSGRSPVRKRSG